MQLFTMWITWTCFPLSCRWCGQAGKLTCLTVIGVVNISSPMDCLVSTWIIMILPCWWIKRLVRAIKQKCQKNALSGDVSLAVFVVQDASSDTVQWLFGRKHLTIVSSNPREETLSYSHPNSPWPVLTARWRSLAAPWHRHLKSRCWFGHGPSLSQRG